MKNIVQDSALFIISIIYFYDMMNSGISMFHSFSTHLVVKALIANLIFSSLQLKRYILRKHFLS